MQVIKRDGSEAVFDKWKIINAIRKASNETAKPMDDTALGAVAEVIRGRCTLLNRAVDVEEIQEMVETELMRFAEYDTAKAYIRYRYAHNIQRGDNGLDKRILSIVDYQNEEAKQENSNKNPEIIPTQRDYIAGEVSKAMVKKYVLPDEVVRAHDEGVIHVHDMDYMIQHSHNCCLVNLEDMLQNGTVISGTKIEKPHTFSTACNIATQIIAQVASSQYGGQTITMAHLSPFVEDTRRKYYEEFSSMLPGMTNGDYDSFIEKLVADDIKRGVQTLQYQVITLMTTNGQAPFVTLFLDINEVPEGKGRDDLALCIEEVLNQRIQGVKNDVGEWITPAFPKLIYALDENNMAPDSPWWYLTELSAKCTAKRMVPDYISNKVQRQLKIDKNGNGQTYPCMGCRSFLTPYVDGNDTPKYYGRFNQGVVTINLPDVALSSGGDFDKFWQIFDDRLELCHKALQCKHERLRGTLSDVAPILWQHGALARLNKGETIDKLLYGGYSTISLGYAGLYECTRYMTGKSHTEEGGKEFALSVMMKLNDATAKWKEQHNVAYSLYGTPLETTTYKFAKCLQKRFGIVEGITDRGYITNSYHVNVREEIDAFSKLGFEAEFQALSPGGAISYVEVPNLQNNIPAVLAVIQYIYDNIMYAELNTKSDYCQVCGFDGEIKIVEDEHGKLEWECPRCGNRDQHKMNVCRRTCGYLGTNFWNQGRTEEIKDRVLHL